jgi:hypothetical protein
MHIEDSENVYCIIFSVIEGTLSLRYIMVMG